MPDAGHHTLFAAEQPLVPDFVTEQHPLGLYVPDREPYWFDRDVVLYHADFVDVAKYMPPVDIVMLDPRRDGKIRYDEVAMAISAAHRDAIVFCDWFDIAEMPKASSCLAIVNTHRARWPWHAALQYRRGGSPPIPSSTMMGERSYGNTNRATRFLRARIIETLAGISRVTILDPSCGDCETLVAAKLAGQRAIGIEPDADKCKAIADELSQQLTTTAGSK